MPVYNYEFNNLNRVMSPSITISVLMPAYNVAAFVDDSLAAILAQLGERHELIVVDDGSSDATAARVEARQLAHAGAQVRLVRQDNQGISAARNTALRHARGDYIVFVDSDDRLRPGALAALDAVIAECAPDVIACAFRMWYPANGAKDHDVALSYAPARLIDSRNTILGTYFMDRQMYVWSKVFKRTIYAALPAPVFPPQRLFEDVATVPRLLDQCRSLYYLPQAILDYRQHAVSITQAVSERWCEDFAAALLQVSAHFDTHPLPEASRWQFDALACHIYIGIVKSSCQLPAAAGARVRAAVATILTEALGQNYRDVLHAIESGAIVSNRPAQDRSMVRQVRRALAGSWTFLFSQTVSRKLKRWRRARPAAAA